MHETAWKIINGLCGSIGWGFFLCLFFGDLTIKHVCVLGGLGIVGVLLALIVGKFFFPSI